MPYAKRPPGERSGNYTAKEKLKALKSVVKDGNISEAAAKIGAYSDTVRRWVRDAEANNPMPEPEH